MTRINDILAAVAAKLETRFPEEDVYRNQPPAQLMRPSWRIGIGKGTWRQASMEDVLVTLPVTVSAFPQGDADNIDCFETLMNRMQDALELFACGYLAVGDRALAVIRATGEYVSDHAEVVLTLKYQDSRPNSTQEFPMVGNIQTTYLS